MSAPDAPCPVTTCLGVIGGKWKPILLYLVENGCNRFGALGRAIPGISKQMLTSQLRELEADGIITRTIYAEIPPHVEYHLTEDGRSLLPIVHQMREWGVAWLARKGTSPAVSTVMEG